VEEDEEEVVFSTTVDPRSSVENNGKAVWFEIMDRFKVALAAVSGIVEFTMTDPA
jgi:hypothetical protein